MITAIAVLCVSFLLFISYLGKRPKRYPPGPYSFPIIGNLFQLSAEPFKDYMKLSKKYGNIFSVDLGGFKTVVLHDYKLIKEAYSLTNVGGRPVFPNFVDPESGLRRGISFTEGNEWTEQRRFVLKSLRDFGFGKKSMESLVHEEVKELIESFKKDVNKPIYVHHRFNIAVFNALWTIVAGERYSQTETKIQKLISYLTENQLLPSVSLTCFPWFAKLVPEYSGLNASIRNNAPVFDFLKDVISSHKKTFQSGNNRDLVDCYIEQMKQTTDSDSSFYKENGDSNFVMTLYDLFIGGTETTSTTLTWMFLALAHHPDVQEKLNQEIKSVVGNDRLPSLSDKLNLPYVEAVIHEITRISTLIPTMLRRAIEDVEFHGYFIPKGTAVLANLYGINNDSKIWGDPENFRPERFLNEDGTKVVKHEALLPFGHGRRVCPGESLARDQLFLFTASLFQRFKVCLGPNEPNKIESTIGILVMRPNPQRVLLYDRYTQ